MEDDSIDGESVGVSSSERKAGEMLGAKDGDVDVRTSTEYEGLNSEDEIGAGTESVGEGGGVGAIKNLITTLFHPGEEGGGNGKAVGKSEAEPGSGEEIASEEENGGIIKSIVSNLPSSLPEDAAPSTDEASILIHSIVHD